MEIYLSFILDRQKYMKNYQICIATVSLNVNLGVQQGSRILGTGYNMHQIEQICHFPINMTNVLQSFVLKFTCYSPPLESTQKTPHRYTRLFFFSLNISLCHTQLSMCFFIFQWEAFPPSSLSHASIPFIYSLPQSRTC